MKMAIDDVLNIYLSAINCYLSCCDLTPTIASNMVAVVWNSIFKRNKATNALPFRIVPEWTLFDDS